MEIQLKNIFVGDPDGLAEAQKAQFNDLFYKKNKKYEELEKNPNKFIVTGRKGTGKTLLAKYYELQMKAEHGVAKYIDKDQVLFRQLQAIGNGLVPQRERASFITYAILKEISSLLCDEERAILRGKGFFEKIKIKRVIKKLKRRIDKNNILNFEKTGIKFQDESAISGKATSSKLCELSGQRKLTNEESYSRVPYYDKIEELKKDLFELACYKKVSIIIDDLDEYDERIATNTSFAKFLSKFIEVTYKLNLELHKSSPGSKIILLFRSDLFRFLHNDSTNLNKYVVNSQVNLNWLKDSNTTQPEKHILMDMIFNKIRTSIPEWYEKTNFELYEMLFPAKIKGRETLKYLLNYSHGRPRDIVNLLNKIIYRYPDAHKFTNDMFQAVEQEYSIDFCNELRNEMSLYYGSDYINACFSMLTLIRKNNFWKDEAEKVIYQNQQLAIITNLDEALEMLYRYGAIGNMKALTQKNLKFYFGYREDGSETLNYAEKFTVHFALRMALL
ncbi:P-loop ATPase, Sll1717 family [Enterocloster citroniae]